MRRIELLNASAGSGKTYSLTGQIIEYIKDSIEPESLMATTFTNKAAAELRERIRLQLLAHNKADEAQRIFDGFVGTVNSICARLLTEYAIDAGLSPALDVLPDEDGSRLFQIAISRVIQKHSGDIEPSAIRLCRDGSGSGYNKRPDWRDDVRRIVDLARANQLSGKNLLDCGGSSWESLQDLFGPISDKDLNSELKLAVDSAVVNLESIDNPKKTTSGSLEKLKKSQKLRGMGVDIPWVEWVRIAKLETNKDGEGELDNVNRIAEGVLGHPDFQDDVQQMIKGVFKCAAEALESYKEFKRKQGLMDFVDQETIVLDLARNNTAFRESMNNRLKLLMVDEFQDTSPIQLALFLELNAIAGKSVWVGDPKQAIYGFRGTDPQLMIEVTKLITNTKSLDKSWRSKENLVKFCNAVFSNVFHNMDEDKVCLGIPDERKEKAKGGWIESWNLPVKNNPEEALSIASGVKDLLSRRNDLKPSDIAILCRSNNQCEDIASSLEELGIRASATQGFLLETKECKLAIAALRYLNYKRDTVALAEIVHLSPTHAYHDKWLESVMKDKKSTLAEWAKDPMILELEKGREYLNQWTPLETLEYAISKVGLLRTLKSWSNASLRLSNLDKLRGSCVAYLDQCRARRSAATIAGFIAYLQEVEPGKAQGSGDHTVHVLTYHRSKGLEWPVVVLTSLDSGSRASAFGSDVVEAPSFDPSNPLVNRSIRYWPWPFESQKNFPVLDSKLVDREEEKLAKEKDRQESHRIMYVGMTRARDGMIFAIRKHITKTKTSMKTGWLDELTDKSGKPVLLWPLEAGENVIKIKKKAPQPDEKSYEIFFETKEYKADDSEESAATQTNYTSPEYDDIQEHPPAHISPSGITASSEAISGVEAILFADFGYKITINGKPDAASLGSAVHDFLGANSPDNEESLLRDIALGSLQRWGVDETLDVEELLVARKMLLEFIENNYSSSKILREWPITLVNSELQLMQGWIDMLLETPDGYVIIDHKTHSGSDNQEHVKQYAPQLAAYKECIERASGKAVIKSFIHLPIDGQIYELNI